MSGFMQNPSVTALFLPVASRLSSRTGVVAVAPAAADRRGDRDGRRPDHGRQFAADPAQRPDRVGQPQPAFGRGDAVEPLPMFAPLPIGIVLLVAGLLYFRYLGPQAGCATARSEAEGVTPARTESYFAQRLRHRRRCLRTDGWRREPAGRHVDRRGRSAARTRRCILALKTGSDARLAPPADQMHLGRQRARRDGPARSGRRTTRRANDLKLSSRLRNFGDLFNPSRAGISEAVIPPTSHFIGQHPGPAAPAQALRHQPAGDQPRQEGTARGHPPDAAARRRHAGLPQHLDRPGAGRRAVATSSWSPTTRRRNSARTRSAMAMASSASHAAGADHRCVPVPIALMAGAAGMLVTGVLNMDEAYSAINWKTVFLMACLIPLGWAMDSTGAAAWMAQQTCERLGRLACRSGCCRPRSAC